MKTKVVLIGGSPGVGKTTLGRSLASHLGWPSLSVDDLFTAARAVTTPDSHPALHFQFTARDYLDYYTNRSPEQLIAEADAQHQATWPAAAQVIRNHADWGTPIVIDGWALRPSWVDALELDNVLPAWLVATRELLQKRQRTNLDFYAASEAPEQMMANFLARSLWHNQVIEAEATRYGMKILHQDGTVSAEELRDTMLSLL